MSDPLKHECGIGFIRLLKPLSHYHHVYGNALWGMNKLYLLMEKQHNRGQDGAGLASLKIDHPIGSPYLQRLRSIDPTPLKDIYKQLSDELNKFLQDHPDKLHDEALLRKHFSFSGEVLMGHVRYGTHGENTIQTIHPFERKSNWRTKNMLVSGNFNMTNVEEILAMLTDAGQHPKDRKDTITVLENIGYHVDEANDAIYHKYREQGFAKSEISQKIADEIDLTQILSKTAKHWDGGYVIQGILGHGDAFIMRDPHGIRPAFYYADDEFIACASERAALATVFNKPVSSIKEIEAGHVLIIKANGQMQINRFAKEAEKKACSFERIYFSRGSDAQIYKERKKLGKLLIPQILEAINHDLEHTVFSYIPNTAETAFLGMTEGFNEYLNKAKAKEINALALSGSVSESAVEKILERTIRIEKAAIKDVKLRTFITDDAHRGDMVAHVYDTTHDILEANVDQLVVIDDSIVRGTTLRESILRILYRLKPKKIVIVSSAPQIRYPDCYGIDMSNLNTLVAFTAAVELVKEMGDSKRLDDIYATCVELLNSDKKITYNPVNRVFDGLSDEAISAKIAEMLKPDDVKCDVEIVYQTIPNLHKACPDNAGDWYFSGDFPTAGGNRVACRAFANFFEGKNIRAY
jgi:amidophosphoribosyltransferase